MSNTYQEPMANGLDHPLKHVPPEVLETARNFMRELSISDGYPPSDMIEPVADSFVMSMLPHLQAARGMFRAEIYRASPKQLSWKLTSEAGIIVQRANTRFSHINEAKQNLQDMVRPEYKPFEIIDRSDERF
jgi:hypothetical protein